MRDCGARESLLEEATAVVDATGVTEIVVNDAASLIELSASRTVGEGG